jgi:hypothetical protein
MKRCRCAMNDLLEKKEIPIMIMRDLFFLLAQILVSTALVYLIPIINGAFARYIIGKKIFYFVFPSQLVFGVKGEESNHFKILVFFKLIIRQLSIIQLRLPGEFERIILTTVETRIRIENSYTIMAKLESVEVQNDQFCFLLNQTMKRTFPFLLADEAFLYLFVSMYQI